MIVKLSGKLDYVGADCVHVTLGDVTHELMVPAADIPLLQSKVGQPVQFFTYEYLEGNASFGQLAPKMLGFLRLEDREFFDLFTTVKGIGTRKALRALAIPTSQIAAAIALKDTRKLASLPQIGKRAAETIVAELHGKVEKFAIGHAASAPIETLPDYQQGAIAALVTLGERRNDAENWVRRVCDVDPSLKDPKKIVPAVFRLKSGGMQAMARERIVSGDQQPEDENRPEAHNPALRPRKLNEYIGQPELIERIRIAVEAAKRRGEPMEHVLLSGPPGLGKTTLAHIIADEMTGAAPKITSGPALVKPGDLVGILTNLKQGDVLFIDEIHRISIVVEEYLYPAMENYSVDVVMDSGAHAQVMTIPVAPFTLIGATTRTGLISGPMRSRFGIAHHLEFYSPQDLLKIVTRSAELLNLPAEKNALFQIAARSRGTPRVANRLLRRVRDFAVVRSHGKLTPDVLDQALALEGIDQLGLDPLDRRFMAVMARDYEGGPVGIEAMAATMGEERDTLEDVVEPFLLQTGFIRRTPKGRQLTAAAYSHLGMTRPPPPAAPSAESDPALF